MCGDRRCRCICICMCLLQSVYQSNCLSLLLCLCLCLCLRLRLRLSVSLSVVNCDTFPREKCAISVYLMPMHFECAANTPSVFNHALNCNAPSSLLSVPPASCSHVACHDLLRTCCAATTATRWRLNVAPAENHFATFASSHDAGPQSGVNSSRRADWWVTHPEMFSTCQANAAATRRNFPAASERFASKKPTKRLCQRLTNWAAKFHKELGKH